MGSYKTPGVYVEEISLLPPSVAQVETAIPAFIGYTKIAKEYANDDLDLVPTKISSLLEFVEFYGGAPAVEITTVELDSLNQVTDLDLTEKYYMYECLRMFYANGGGDCYIVSVGKYGATVANGDGSTDGFLAGLATLKKVDEPTLLLAPDAVLMSQTDMDSLHQAMLTQCADLQDRFTIMDLRYPEPTQDFQDTVDKFREGIGMNNLKYGAVYGPWIKANLSRTVKYSDIKGKIKQNAVPVTLSSLITDTNAKALADRLDNLVTDQTSVTSGITSLQGSYSSVQIKYDSLLSAINSANSNTSAKTAVSGMIGLFTSAIDFMEGVVTGSTLTDIGTGSLKASLAAAIGATITSTKSTISDMIKDADTTFTLTIASGLPSWTFPGSAPGTYFTTGTSLSDKAKGAISDYAAIFSLIKSALSLIESSANSFLSSIETSAIDAIPALKTIFRSIASEYLTLPPSATIAGVYATVDRNRGVWKAPANVSLNSVVGVTDLIDNNEQASLNVDVVAGKSVNVIRPFTGKGILVWGARTLAGNDNEWRYVPVRRFYIMAEESIRKATEQFVFEPNDANTWVRIQAMIENFLVQQWKAGALTGAKPEQAFYVRVGLGQTMTAQDILEGRMNIEIGMAVVRPAEFIILKFSHKMQEA